jgi:phenylalanine-4-hydroxylase
MARDQHKSGGTACRREDIFSALANRQFPVTLHVRHPRERLKTRQPDVMHEVIGHVPLLACKEFAELHIAFGRAASASQDALRVMQVARVYWFTMEFAGRSQIKSGSIFWSSPARLNRP